MSEGFIGALVFLIGVIFTAGGIINGQKKENAQLKIDISRIGNKQRDEEKNAARRYHNICMVLESMIDDKETRFKIAGLLKED